MNNMTRKLFTVPLFSLCISLAAFADHTTGGGTIRLTPADEWDRGASEGQRCSSDYNNYQPCNRGLICHDDGSWDRSGICRLPCRSDNQCHAGQYCSNQDYNGVCLENGGYHPGHPGHGGRRAYEGQYCSIDGRYHPRCAHRLTCANPDRYGIGICAASCYSDYDCDGGRCYNGTCYNRRPR